MGYLADLVQSLNVQLNAAITDRERVAIATQMATVQTAAGSQGLKITVGYLADLKVAIENRLDTVTTPIGDRKSLVEQLALIQSAMGAAGAGGAGAQIGDLKFGIQTADHNGWYLCDNRPIIVLPAAVQARYTTDLGIATGLLPNASVGTTLTVGTRATLLGSSTISQANLPNVNLTTTSNSAGTPGGTITIATHSSTSGGSDPNPTTGVSNLQQTDRTPENTQTLGSSMAGGFSGTAMGGHNHTVSLGGSGTAFIPASVGGNMFIYLGV